MTLASPFLDILVSLKTSWVGSVLSLIAIQFPWKLFEQSSWCFKCYFLILQYWNWSSWQVTILRPSVINRELYLWATRGLKLAEPMGAAPTLYLARQASVNAVWLRLYFEIGNPGRLRSVVISLKARRFTINLQGHLKLFWHGLRDSNPHYIRERDVS